MRRNKSIYVLLLMVLIFTLAACAALETAQNLTPKQQLTVWMQVYNSTYDDTMTMANSPSLTQAQKDLINKKKAILTQAWPLLKTATIIIDSGGTLSEDQSVVINGLINQLTTLAIGGK